MRFSTWLKPGVNEQALGQSYQRNFRAMSVDPPAYAGGIDPSPRSKAASALRSAAALQTVISYAPKFTLKEPNQCVRPF